MAVKPEEIINWENSGKRLEALIDQALEAKWKGKHPVRFELPKELPLAIVSDLMKLYREAGWTLKHEIGENQKDGSWNTFEFSVAEPKPVVTGRMWSDDDPSLDARKGQTKVYVKNPRTVMAEEIKRWAWSDPDGGAIATCPDPYVAADKLTRLLGIATSCKERGDNQQNCHNCPDLECKDNMQGPDFPRRPR